MATFRGVAPRPWDARRAAAAGRRDSGGPRGAFAIDPDPLTIDVVIDGAGLDVVATARDLLGLTPRLRALAVPVAHDRGPIRPQSVQFEAEAVLVRFRGSDPPPGRPRAGRDTRRPGVLPPIIVAHLESVLERRTPGRDASCLVRVSGHGAEPCTYSVTAPSLLDRTLGAAAARDRP